MSLFADWCPQASSSFFFSHSQLLLHTYDSGFGLGMIKTNRVSLRWLGFTDCGQLQGGR